MPAKQRMFAALTLHEADAARLAAFAEALLGPTPGARLVPARNLHVTLVFCGSHPAERGSELVDAVRREAAGARAFSLEPAGMCRLGAVAALGLRPALGARALIALQTRLERRLVTAGMARDEGRAWLPHVTLARYGSPREVPHLPGALPADANMCPSGAAAFISVPTPAGPAYRPLAWVGFSDDTSGAPATAPMGGTT
jgi:2'-5' RNA ligase